MLDYLQKFDQLPEELKRLVSTKATVSLIDQLEKKYNQPLAAIVMKIMVGDMGLNELSRYFKSLGLTDDQARRLDNDLRSGIFQPVEDYLAAATEEIEASPITTKPRVKTETGASFFFSPEDEQEIRELTKKFDGHNGSLTAASEIEARVSRIIDQAKINFGSTELAERFKQILRTYLKGIRNKIEIKQAFTKPFSSGGLDFDPESAEKVLQIADANQEQQFKQAEMKPRAKISLPEIDREARVSLKNTGVRDIEFNLAASLKKAKPELKEVKATEFNQLDTKHELPASQPSAPARKVKAPVKPPVMIRKESSLPPKPAIIRRPVDKANKVKLEDVKYVPRIMGPVDELKFMDLTSFRRLSQNPIGAVNKIKEIIDLLEEENYAKRLEGIKAWRMSPTNKLYIQIGQQSIKENKPIEAIIIDRKTRGEEYLTNDELTAIMDLNKSLRF